MSNPYAVLGVQKDSTEKEITKAFRAKARKTHPDKQPADASDAEKQRACKAFQELVAAYEVLSDADKRRRHDLETPDPAAARQGAAAAAAAQQQRHRQAQQQQQQQQPDAGSGRPSAASGGERRQASGNARRYVYEEDSDDDRRWAPPKKTAQQEEDERDERRRRQQQENDQRFEGLGSHWVKPPPRCSSAPPREQPDGPPSQFRPKPMPKTKISRPEAKQKKKRRRRGDGDGDSDGTDCSSDVSSVLSFDIHIDLSKFNFTFELIEPEVDTLNHTEVWTIKQPSQGKTSEEKDADKKDGEAATNAAPKPKPKAGSSKPCCALQ